MADTKKTQHYYTEDDYASVMEELPKVIAKAQQCQAETMEPTLVEKQKVLAEIKKFIKRKGRIIYGGTAINDLVKYADASACIYGKYQFADIEFYSFEPKLDIVELCNIFEKQGYNNVVGRAAQHDETFSLSIDFVTYCDISYMPKRIMHGVRTEDISGIKYAHPYFLLIDQLRIFNQPLTASEQRWEKTFKRAYILQKYWPMLKLNGRIELPAASKNVSVIIADIKQKFFATIKTNFLISGFDATNSIIRYIMDYKDVKNNKKAPMGTLKNYLCNTPYLEMVSTNYSQDVKNLYTFLRENVQDASALSLVEYWPFFQFTGYSVDILYKGELVVKVFQSDGYCVPNIQTKNNYQYVGYQYILMMMMIKKFKAFLDGDNVLKKASDLAVSHLVSARDIFLGITKKGPINDTHITDFKVTCMGNTVDFRREAMVRNQRQWEKYGKKPFRYEPATFLKKTPEEQAKFNPGATNYRNSSGNKITSVYFLMFPLDSSGNIVSQERDIDDDEDVGDEEQE